ncbi:MAG TPA: response regulator [Magnetospirillaceae bacterium]|jgi:DNA-binding response OmpR family regulator
MVRRILPNRDRVTRTIMVVDDDPISLKQITATLKRDAYEVLAFSDGESALYRLPGLDIDLIILDSIMPRMDGPEVLRHLKDNALAALVPVMMLTGKTEKASVEKALQLGAEDYMAKPVEPAKLLERVAKLLEKSEKRVILSENGALKMPRIRGANRVHLDLSTIEDITTE